MPMSLGTAQTITTSDTSQQFTAMVSGVQYRFTCTATCWIALGSDPTAEAGAANSHLVIAGQTVLLANVDGNTEVAVIQDSAAGDACLSAIQS